MRTPRRIAGLLWALAAVAMVVAGPVAAGPDRTGTGPVATTGGAGGHHRPGHPAVPPRDRTGDARVDREV
jgi:hypothetical protein